MCVTFHVSEQLLSEIFINLRNIQHGVIINLRTSPQKKCLLILSYFK
jgi:hypothetical protein